MPDWPDMFKNALNRHSESKCGRRSSGRNFTTDECFSKCTWWFKWEWSPQARVIERWTLNWRMALQLASVREELEGMALLEEYFIWGWKPIYYQFLFLFCLTALWINLQVLSCYFRALHGCLMPGSPHRTVRLLTYRTLPQIKYFLS